MVAAPIFSAGMGGDQPGVGRWGDNNVCVEDRPLGQAKLEWITLDSARASEEASQRGYASRRVDEFEFSASAVLVGDMHHEGLFGRRRLEDHLFLPMAFRADLDRP